MMTPNIQTICSLAVGTTMIALSSAHAGDTAPVLEVDWIVDGVADAGSLTGSGLGAGVYEYANSTIGDGFEINWSFIVTDNGASGGFEILSSALAFTNTSDAASVFEIGVLLPVGLAPGTAFYGGSISGSLTGDIDGGLLATSGDSALFAALVDGETIATLYDAPFGLATAPFESANLAAEAFGEPIPGLELAAAQESMSIELDFELGAGDQFTVSSNYVAQVPAPGVLALLGLGGLASRRRRA